MASLVQALLIDLKKQLEVFDLRPTTIYFGGGTPSLLSKSALTALLEGMRGLLDLNELAEWSTEANPMTFDAEKAHLLFDAGVNRVSLGVQSWKPHLLETLGRDHTPEQAKASYHLLRDVGFPVVNVDLMFSLPGQSLQDWEDDLDETLALNPHHVSAYNLTYEEDTPFFDQLGKGSFQEDVDDNADHFYRADTRLTASGYEHYEISNYAKPGCQSRHNQAYWMGKDYLGLGPSAVSTVGGQRWKSVPDTARYVRECLEDRAPSRIEEETLTEEDRHNERIALLLRTSEGILADHLAVTPRKRADELADEGVLVLEKGRYRLADAHRAMVDPVAAELFV